MQELLTINQVIETLFEIRRQRGNIKVAEVFYGNDDYPKIELGNYRPEVIINPLNEEEYIVIFDGDK